MQIFIAGLYLLLLEVLYISGVPHNYDRYRRSPHRTVMLSGYYGRTPQYSSEYNPEGAMTAFISGDTLATNSFLGGKYYPVQGPGNIETPVEENIHQDAQPVIISPTESGERPEEEGKQETPEKNDVAIKRNPKRKQVVKPQTDGEEDEEEDGWPFQLGRKGGPSYTAFFPIMFGGYRGLSGSGRDNGSGIPGSATAIANSFSTGRGGVASSHATAYGDPYVSTLLKSGFNAKKKPTQNDDYI
ncbi:hypothetical protein FQR65_LT10025 [Abscondita terminalis]|nr:hypothetical protein FQR65_LT10025 [Abscondita terminalis]